MNISLNGYGTGYATLEAAKGLTEGVLAKISANRTAAAAGDGEAFIGPVLSVRDGLALCQLSGICTVAYTGSAPALVQGFVDLHFTVSRHQTFSFHFRPQAITAKFRRSSLSSPPQ